MVGTHFLLHVFCPPGPPTSPLLNCIIPQERHPFSMVIFSNADLCNTISLRFPSGWYPGTTPLHSLIEEKEWELVAWRLCGIDWDEIRSICSDTAANIEVSPFDNLFKRIKGGGGFSVSPNISSLCVPPIPEVSFPRSGDGKLPLHVAIDALAPTKTLRMLLGHDGALIRSYSEYHGLPLYYACKSQSLETPLGQRVQTIGFLLERYPHAAFIKSPNGDYPLHALMRNHPSLQLVEMFHSLELDVSGETSPLLGCLLDDDGQAPLHIGLEFNAPEDAIRTLIDMNPDVVGHRRDTDGKTPADLANRYIIGDDVVAELLKLEDPPRVSITYR
jgi:hypothetical protein